MKRFRRAVAAAASLAVLAGMLIVGTGASAGAAAPEGECLAAAEGRRILGGIDLCGTPIVFADGKTDDLFLTDTSGSDPYRLTHTRMLESNPAGLFPWVFYEGLGNKGSDIYQMSLLDPGHGRIRITGLKSSDHDPTAVLAPLGLAPEGADLENAKTLQTEGGIFLVLLAFTSDREVGKTPKCGLEVYLEFLTLTGPERITDCDRADKYDPEFTDDGNSIAYSSHRWSNYIGRIEVNFGDGGTIITPVGPDRDYPTWNPFCCPGKAPVPGQPAGEDGLNYTQLGPDFTDGELYSIWGDGSGDGLFATTGNPNWGFGESEWSACGCEYGSIVQSMNGRSWIVLIGKGLSPPLTDKQKFLVQSFDFVSEPD